MNLFAKQNCEGKNCSFLVSDLRKIPFDDNHFDCTICLGDTVSCCGNDSHKAVLELKRITKKGGKIIIGVDNLYGKFVNAVSNKQYAEAKQILQKKEAFEISNQFKIKCFDINEFILLSKRMELEIVHIYPVVSSLYNYRSSQLSETDTNSILELETLVLATNMFSWGGDHTIYVLKK